MQNVSQKIIGLLLLLALVACTPTQKKSSKSSEDGGDDVDQQGVDPTPEPAPGPYDHLPPLHKLSMRVAGGTSWKVYEGSDPIFREYMLSMSEAKTLFSSDNRLQVRFKALPRFNSPSSSNCAGHETMAQFPEYDNLWFDLKLRDILCTNSSCTNLELGSSAYGFQRVGPIPVGEWSQVYDLSTKRNSINGATTIEISEVASDSYCRDGAPGDSAEYSTNCPLKINAGTCWQLEIEVSTDFTRPLQ